MVPPSRQCSEKPAKVTETAEHEKKKKIRFKVQGNRRFKSVKNWWFFLTPVMDNISEFPLAPDRGV